MKQRFLTGCLVLFLGSWLAHAPLAGAAPEVLDERRKIDALIKQVEELKDAAFIRNGSSYNAANAATFLRRKWQANRSQVKSARDFIDKIASVSSTSGTPYRIRLKDGREFSSREFLLAELQRLEGA